jgi:hypothetical protein
MKHLLPFALLMIFLSKGSTQVTFTKDIAPIIYNNCTKCHRPNEIGPFPMTNYDEVVPWAITIKYVTAIHYMPPWKPDPQFARYLGERILTQEQIDLIGQWVDNGTPYGNAAEEPPLPVFPTGSQVGTPDLVLHMAESYEHKGGNADEYRVFVLPTGLTEDKEISTIEIRPGNTRILHHALISYDLTGEAQALDAADPKYGYDGFGGFGISNSMGNMFPGYVPGQKPIPFPQGLGQLLPAGSDLLVQVHYGPKPFPEKDSTTVNIFFKKEPVEREVQNFIFIPFDPLITNGPFFIPANTVKTFHCQYTTPVKVSVFAIWPHAHLLNEKYLVYVVHPNGDTSNLIKIDDWDFNWQGSYNFRNYIVLEPGSTIHVYATYDNTANNPSNPNQPPKFVTWGEKTTDEMLFLPISYVFYKTGDENIVFQEETTAVGDPEFPSVNHYLAPVVPNPANNEAFIHYVLATSDKISLRVLDMQGRIVRTLAVDEYKDAGPHTMRIDLGQWPSGAYFVQMAGTNFTQSQKVVVNH